MTTTRTRHFTHQPTADLLPLDPTLWDYVIVHELLHFSIPNHGRLWKALMRAHLGDWERAAERLNQEGVMPSGRPDPGRIGPADPPSAGP